MEPKSIFIFTLVLLALFGLAALILVFIDKKKRRVKLSKLSVLSFILFFFGILLMDNQLQSRILMVLGFIAGVMDIYKRINRKTRDDSYIFEQI